MKIPSTIADALKALLNARSPESVFGNDVDGITEMYRAWAKLVHEDRVPVSERGVDKPAHKAFILLQAFKEKADKKIDRGTYGDGKLEVIAVIKTKTTSYTLNNLIHSDEISDFYEGESKGKPILFRFCRSPKNNDLMKNEADILAELPTKLDPKHTGYFPNLLDSFEVTLDKVRTRANVFNFTDNAVSLKEVKDAYPNGLDPRDAAWMWNRLVEALHLLHVNGYVHAAVTPDRFIISPEMHTGCLFDFCYTVKMDETVKAISPKWKANYPKEVFNKKPVNGSTDLYMASYCLDYLIVPNDIPTSIRSLLKACRLGKAHRSHSAKELHADFKTCLKRLYGPRNFRAFSMPTKSKT